MSPYRIGGGIAALALIALLAIVTVQWFRHTDLIWPTVSVTPEAQSSSTVGQSGSATTSAESPAMAILAERTQLQVDKNTKPPTTENENLTFQPGVANGESIARGWLQSPGDQQLLTPPSNVAGLSSLPYRNADRLEQPAGRDWRSARNNPVRFGGSWLIFGIGLALALFLFARGRIQIVEGRSGETVPRFNAIERSNHWMTASAFIIMALTGLVVLYGKPLLLPLIGPEAFTTWSQWAKYAHNFLSFPFTLGVVLIFLMWIAANIPNRIDFRWLRAGGGIVGHEHPPAQKFNAGQKAIYWIVVVGGGITAATGYVLMFPFYMTDIAGMQSAQMLHAVVAMLFIAVMIAHIYIGTIGMEGAFEAMGTGDVDVNWAKQHHSLWLQDEQVRSQAREPGTRPAATPAE